MARLQATISNAIEGMSTEELAQHPEGKWSASQILEHLHLTYQGTIKNFERRVAEGKTCGEGDRRKKMLPRIVVTRLGYMPQGRKSSGWNQPRSVSSQQAIIQVMESLIRMDSVISESELRFSRRKAIAEHPVLGPLTSDEWRGFHLAHGLLHVRQIRALRRALLQN